MGIGTFGSFTQARLAIYAAQTGLTVTGNNISNVNTPGYTRQRLDQRSLYNAGADRYYSTTGVKVGQGVLCYGLSQLRSPYLDIQYRSKSADVGAFDGLLEGLEGLKKILDETGKGGEITEGKEFGLIAAEFRKVYDALNNLTAQTGHNEYDVQVRSACKNLADLLRSYASDLEEHYNNTMQQFEENVSKVNTILTNIRNLNENIRQADIYGDDALEMRDERNLLIDQLSEYMKIDVEYSMETIGPGVEVEKLTIRLGNDNPDTSVHTDSSVLVDGLYATQLSIDPMKNEKYDENYTPDPNDPDDMRQYRYLKADGTGTNSLTEAAHHPNLNITLSELRDRHDRILYTYKYFEETAIDENEYNAGAPSTSVTGPDGVITITTFRKQLSTEVIRNPDWDRTLNTAYEFLTSSGQGTNNRDEAATVLSENPNFNPNDPPSDTNGKYLDAAGNPTNDPAKAARVPKENPDYDETKAEGYRYIKYESYKAKPNGPYVAPDDYTTKIDEARGEPSYFKQEYKKIPSTSVSLDDNDLYGRLQSQRELLTESGEFSAADTVTKVDENALTKRGIPYYQKSLDLLAHQFATEMNKANQGYLVNADGNLVTKVWDPQGGTEKTGGFATEVIELNDGNGNTYIPNKAHMLGPNEWDMSKVPTEIQDWLKANGHVDANGDADMIHYLKTEQNVKVKGTGNDYKDADGNTLTESIGMFRGGPLFSNKGDTDDVDPPITASNITVSYSWSKGPMIVNSFICPADSTEPASSDSDNIINNLTSLIYKTYDFRPDTIHYDGVDNVSHDAMFTGKFEDMFLNMSTVLGNDMLIATKQLDNNYAAQVSIDTSRDSISSVDFNDEAMNLMMYAKAYNAACRMMTTVDSVLDKLINNTGVTT